MDVEFEGRVREFASTCEEHEKLSEREIRARSQLRNDEDPLIQINVLFPFLCITDLMHKTAREQHRAEENLFSGAKNFLQPCTLSES